MMGFMDILSQAMAANGGQANSNPINNNPFAQVADHAPPDALAQGLSAAFGSKQTPPIGDMVAQLFGQSNAGQQAGMLNQLLRTLGPTVMAGLAGGALNKMMSGNNGHITPEQAAQISPAQVQEVVNGANDAHPAVADQLGAFYAQHRGLINGLGGLAASIAMMKMKDHLTGDA
jgi:hypothetical protein